ncbi:hypothetical protein HF086_002917 [Spodoptera exigua]|uniref:Uncharacterized protein n=1 Tax=Spodoptera exigua TaxID=7107 RepID=A0A922SDP7_SPOEX|nr:hypothetical protein HF086_002917 [Spodoptera exigua]
MIPEPDSSVVKGQVLPKPTKMAADELHKALRNMLVGKDKFPESMTEEEINRLMLEFAYRGCDLRYYKSENE